MTNPAPSDVARRRRNSIHPSTRAAAEQLGAASYDSGRATATTVGLDIAKSVFQVHGVDADDNVVVCRRLRRRYVLTFFQKLLPCFDDFRTGVLFAAAVIR
jgi:hypothetical protein